MEQESKIGNIFSKVIGFVKSHIKIIGIAAAALIAVIVLISVFTSGPKKAVKAYIKAMDKGNVDKYIRTIDFAGQEAWTYSFYNLDDFDKDNYKDFIEDYKDVDKEDLEDTVKSLEDTMEDSFDNMKDDYKKYKVKLEKFKGVEELGEDLYLVKAKVSVRAVPEDEDDEEIDSSNIYKFVVYKNKIIDSQV